MKKVILLIVLACSAFVFTSCEKEGSYSRKIIGTWDLVKEVWFETGYTEECVFRETEHYERWVITKETIKVIGKYSVSGKEGSYMTEYRIEGDTLYDDSGDAHTIEKLDSKELVLRAGGWSRSYFVKVKN